MHVDIEFTSRFLLWPFRMNRESLLSFWVGCAVHRPVTAKKMTHEHNKSIADFVFTKTAANNQNFCCSFSAERTMPCCLRHHTGNFAVKAESMFTVDRKTDYILKINWPSLCRRGIPIE